MFQRILATILVVYALVLGAVAPAVPAPTVDAFGVLCSALGHDGSGPAEDGSGLHDAACCILCTAVGLAFAAPAPQDVGRRSSAALTVEAAAVEQVAGMAQARGPLQARAPPAG